MAHYAFGKGQSLDAALNDACARLERPDREGHRVIVQPKKGQEGEYRVKVPEKKPPKQRRSN